LRRVRIAVRIEPDHAERLALLGEVAGRARDRADREAVIAAEHERHAPLAETALDLATQLLARCEDRLFVAELALADLLSLGNLHVEIDEILDAVAELLADGLSVG